MTAPGLAVTGSTLKATPETTAGTKRWTTTASDRADGEVEGRGGGRDRGPGPGPGLPHVGPKTVAESRGQDAPDGVEEGGLAVDAEDGVELAGEGGRAGVLADERRAHGDGTRAEAAVGAEDGAAQAVGHRPGEASATGRFEGGRIGIEIGIEIAGTGPRGGLRQGLAEGRRRDDEPGRDGESGLQEAGEAGALPPGDARIAGPAARQGDDEPRHTIPFLIPLQIDALSVAKGRGQVNPIERKWGT